MRHLFTTIATVSAFALVTAAVPAQAKTKNTTTTTTTTTTAESTTAQQATTTETVRNDVDVPDIRPMSADSGSAFKVGFDGFVDVQGKVTNHRDVSDRGFTLNDAALMMRANYKFAEAVVDLPFYTTDTGTPSSTNPHSNAFNFATEQAQAYLNFHNFSSMPIYVRAGQYDSFFGLEANDSRDRFFADKGIIKNMLPWTSTGALAGWSHDGMTLQAQVANGPSLATNPALATGQWTSSGGSMTDTSPSYALNAKYDKNGKLASLSVMFDHNSGAVVGSPDGLLVDAIVGCKENRWSTGLEFVDRKDPGTAGALNTSGDKADYNNSWGIAVLGAYHMTDALSAGMRFEYAHDPVIAPGTIQLGDVIQGSIGPVWQLEKNLALRADITAGHMASHATIDGRMDYSLTASAVASLF